MPDAAPTFPPLPDFLRRRPGDRPAKPPRRVSPEVQARREAKRLAAFCRKANEKARKARAREARKRARARQAAAQQAQGE